jgi:N6-adenosine-specific RNA methylase IME4
MFGKKPKATTWSTMRFVCLEGRLKIERMDGPSYVLLFLCVSKMIDKDRDVWEGSGRKMNLAHENCVLRTEGGGKEGMDVQSYVLIVKRSIVYKASNMKKKLFEVVMRCESLHARLVCSCR